ncbi:hypothetical protein SB861_37715 [Paraburkholderia sp. SIMBA_049]
MDLNFGAGNNVTPYNFTVPTGLGVNGNSFDFSSLNNFGLASPTQGANAGGIAGLGGVAGSPSNGLGMNLPTFQLGLSGLSTLANLYTGLKSLGLAQDQFSFNKDMTAKNYANSVASYNTALSDKANARAVTEGQSTAARDAYINANRLN